MNSVILVGRLVRDPETRYAQNDKGTAVTRFTLAVDRHSRDEADFISCVAFGKTGEFVGKYFLKGRKMILRGHIQTGSYEKEGRKVYTTDVIADEVEFGDSKKDLEEAQAAAPAPAPKKTRAPKQAELPPDDFEFDTDENEDLPF